MCIRDRYQPDWGHDSHSLAFTVTSVEHRFRLFLIVNAWWQPLTFELPPTASVDPEPIFTGDCWHRWIDTARSSPEDIVTWEEAVPLAEPTYTVQPRSLVALVVGRPGG